MTACEQFAMMTWNLLIPDNFGPCLVSRRKDLQLLSDLFRQLYAFEKIVCLFIIFRMNAFA